MGGFGSRMSGKPFVFGGFNFIFREIDLGLGFLACFAGMFTG
jgi:hypothetical protein